MPRPSASRRRSSSLHPSAARSLHCCRKPQSQLQRPEFGRSGLELCRRIPRYGENRERCRWFFQRQRYRCRPLWPAVLPVRPYLPRSPTGRLISRLPKFDLDRLRSELQAIHPHRDDFDSQSVAAMQDSAPIHVNLLRCVLAFFSRRSDKSMRGMRADVSECSCVRRERFQSAGRIRYDC